MQAALLAAILAVLAVVFLVTHNAKHTAVQSISAPAAAPDPVPIPDHLDINLYLQQLHQDGFHGTDQKLLKLGEWVCGELATLPPSSGYINSPGNKVVTYLIANGIDQQHAVDFVTDTIAYLCVFLPHR